MLSATKTFEVASASAGAIPALKDDVEDTAVPANSTPKAPRPVTGSYLYVK